jgi:hypothetical protein
VNAWHLDFASMVRARSPRSAAVDTPLRAPGSAWSGWSFMVMVMARVIRGMVVRRRGERAPLEFPQAVGASDRELARLGPDHTRRLADQLRYSHPQRLYLPIAHYH